MRHPLVVIRTVILIATVWLLLGWLLLRFQWVDVRLGSVLPRWTPAMGVPLIVVGAVLVLACGGMLSTRGILSRRGEHRLFPTEFIAFGPFRYLRNPMSLGAVILMTGLGLWGRSTCVLVLTAAVFAFFHALAVYIEEPGLERRFGESYRAYKASVNRWLPRRPSKPNQAMQRTAPRSDA